MGWLSIGSAVARSLSQPPPTSGPGYDATVAQRTRPVPADCWAPGSLTLAATGSGPLSGLTVAVKDMFAIEGHVSSYGHPRWRETHGPAEGTAPVVARLLAAGASVAGLAKLDQIAWSIIGNAGEGIAPLNPAYPGRFTCGSSSGPASAVACGLASIGIGTDTGGSVRAPAAACGLFGLRPTHGAISTDGVLPLAPPFDTVGIFARELPLLGRVLDLLSEGNGGAGPISRLIVPADCLDSVSPETAEAVRAVGAAVAESAGCELADERLGEFFSDEAADLFARNQARQVWDALGPWLAENVEVLAPDVAGRVRRAEQLAAAPSSEREADERAWHAYTGSLGERLPAGTVAVVPVLADLPPLRTASPDELAEFRTTTFRFTAPASLTGRPEVVVPVKHAASGKQIGVGLLGWPGSDAELVRVAGLIRPSGEPPTSSS
jgi:amidase